MTEKGQAAASQDRLIFLGRSVVSLYEQAFVCVVSSVLRLPKTHFPCVFRCVPGCISGVFAKRCTRIGCGGFALSTLSCLDYTVSCVSIVFPQVLPLCVHQGISIILGVAPEPEVHYFHKGGHNCHRVAIVSVGEAIVFSGTFSSGHFSPTAIPSFTVVHVN